jgi:hypothetical protein
MNALRGMEDVFTIAQTLLEAMNVLVCQAMNLLAITMDAMKLMNVLETLTIVSKYAIIQ